jgi:hypothetical protein
VHPVDLCTRWMRRRQGPGYTTSRNTTRIPMAITWRRRLEDPTPREQALQRMFKSTDSSQQCSRCLKTAHTRRMPSKPPTADCNHDSTLCRNCIGRAIRDSLGSPEVRCPEPNCGVYLNPEQVRSWVSDSEYRL